MKRKLNGLLLLILLGAVTVLGVGVHFLHGAQVTRIAKALLAQAERAEQQGDLDRAKEFLAQYLALEPGDVEGLVRYGRILERKATTGPARYEVVQIYEKALRRDPSLREIRRRLVDLAVDPSTALFSDARPHVELLLRDAPEGEQADLTFLLARCKDEAGEFDGDGGAANLYAQARRLAPASIEISARLAEMLRTRTNDKQQADRVMDELVAISGNSAPAYLTRARYRRKFALPGADADVAQALKLAPEDADVLSASADSALSQGDENRAMGHLQRALELHPDRGDLYPKLAELEFKSGHMEEAVKRLKQGSKAVPDNALLKWTFADILIQSGKLEEAVAVIDELKGARVKPEFLSYLEGRLRMVKGNWSEAVTFLQEAQAALSAQRETKELAKRALLMLGDCYNRLGNGFQRTTVCRQAVAIEIDPDPLWVPARLALAASLESQNKFDEALEQYRIVLPKHPAARLAIAKLLLHQNLRRPVAERPRYWPELDLTLSDLEKSGADATQLVILRFDVLAAKGDVSAARDLLEKAIAKQPKQVNFWIALSGLNSREGKADAALALLDDAERRLGDLIELRLARSAYWAERGGDAARVALAKVETNIDGFSAEDQARLWRDLSGAYSRVGQTRDAERVWTLLAKQQPDDVIVRLALFDLAVYAGDADAAERALEQIRRIEGEDGALWRFGRASLLIRSVGKGSGDRKVLAEARGLLAKVATLRPNWSRVPVAEAEIEELDGNTEAAIKAYLRAINELGARNPETIKRTVGLLTQARQFDQATRLIQMLEKEGRPISGELQRLAASLSYQTQDYGHALKLAEQAVSEKSTDLRELLWLGQMRAAAGKPAEPLLRRALELAPDAPEPWQALILYLNEIGKPDQAETALQQAENRLSKDKAALVLAQGYEAIGKLERAGEGYQSALAARPNDTAVLRAAANFHIRGGRPREAERLVQRISDLKGVGDDDAWARRMLPLIIAAGGDRQRSLKALDTLGLAASTGATAASAPTEDLRARAKTLALHPSRARRREAITILEALLERKAGQEEDKLLLAQLYEFDGDWSKAQRQMLELSQAHPKDPSYLVAYTRALLRHERIGEAQVYLQKLEQLAPQRPFTVEVKARVLHARGLDADAVVLLKRLAQEQENQTLQVARLLDELGQAKEAEELYRKYASQPDRIESAFALAGFLGRQGRTREALDLCESAWAKSLPEAVSNVSVMILYGNTRGDDTQYARVERKLVEAIAKAPNKFSIQFDLANLKCLQGRYEEAEAIFRRIYERSQDVGAPLNNLAWMLALQGTKQTEALSLVSQAIEHDGEKPALLDTRGLVHLAMNQADAAVRDFEEAVASGGNAEMYFHLARAYLAAGRRAEAEDALQRTKTLGLKVDNLHPLERDTYAQTVRALAH